MKKIVISIFVLAMMSGAALAGDGAGSLAMPFVNVPHNSATLGEGGVYLARTSSMAYGAFENIATLPLSGQKMDFSASYEMWSPKQTNESFISFGAGMAFGKLAFSLSGSLGNNQPYTEYREGGFEGSSFTPKDMAFGLGAAFGITESLAAGVNAKYLSNTLSSKAAYTAFCVDVMAFGKFGPLGVGGGLRNVGSKVKSYSGAEFSLPTSFAVGAAYDSEAGFGAELDADYAFGGGLDLSAGAHYCWNDMITVRAGYHMGSVLPSFLSVGGGFKIVGIYIDAAYVLTPALASGTVCLGLGYRF